MKQGTLPPRPVPMDPEIFRRSLKRAEARLAQVRKQKIHDYMTIACLESIIVALKKQLGK